MSTTTSSRSRWRHGHSSSQEGKVRGSPGSFLEASEIGRVIRVGRSTFSRSSDRTGDARGTAASGGWGTADRARVAPVQCSVRAGGLGVSPCRAARERQGRQI